MGFWTFVFAISVVSIVAGLINTWIKARHGYPLDGAWGQALHPVRDRESAERIKLLTSENAQLRAEIGSIKDRLETVERIVTDQPSKLSREIEQLRSN